MSIMIKNMRIPKTCSECRFYNTDYDYPYCVASNCSRGYNFNGYVSKMDTCPLIDIPTPHGNLIDIDELAIFGLKNPNCDNSFRFVPCKFVQNAKVIIGAEK